MNLAEAFDYAQSEDLGFPRFIRQRISEPQGAVVNGFPMRIYEYCQICSREHIFNLLRAVRGGGVAYYSGNPCGHQLIRINQK